MDRETDYHQKLLALINSELSHDEASALQEQIENDLELQHVFNRLLAATHATGANDVTEPDLRLAPAPLGDISDGNDPLKSPDHQRSRQSRSIFLCLAAGIAVCLFCGWVIGELQSIKHALQIAAEKSVPASEGPLPRRVSLATEPSENIAGLAALGTDPLLIDDEERAALRKVLDALRHPAGYLAYAFRRNGDAAVDQALGFLSAEELQEMVGKIWGMTFDLPNFRGDLTFAGGRVVAVNSIIAANLNYHDDAMRVGVWIMPSDQGRVGDEDYRLGDLRLMFRSTDKLTYAIVSDDADAPLQQIMAALIGG